MFLSRQLPIAVTLLFLTVLSALGAPQEKTDLLYEHVIALAIKLPGIIQPDGDPVETANTINEQIKLPLDAASQDWMDTALADGQNGDTFRPFLPCYNAAYDLGQVAAAFQRKLHGSNVGHNPEAAAAIFRKTISECETALGRDLTFPAEVK